MKPLHIAIAGYGSAGQAASLLLARDGHRVEVFERVAHPGPVGAGFLLQPTGMGVLLELGLLDAALQLGVPVRRLFGDLPNGRRIMDMRYSELQPQLFGLGMQRTALFQLLHAARSEATQLQFAAEVQSVDAEHGLLRSADGRQHGPYDPACARRWAHIGWTGPIPGAPCGACCRPKAGRTEPSCASATRAPGG